eukprot:SAG31_NODE_3915_length_3755_cov_1.358862_2_plen_99_part_00
MQEPQAEAEVAEGGASGWNPKAGTPAELAAAAKRFGVEVDTSGPEIWRDNAWAAFDGCTLQLFHFQIISATVTNVAMRGIVTLQKPQVQYIYEESGCR